MEIDVTHLAEDAHTYSASRYEIGEGAARITWNNAVNAAGEWDPVYTDGSRVLKRHLVDHFADFGAWTCSEVLAMSKRELVALLIQDVSASIRQDDGRVFHDEEDDRIYFHLGF